MKRLTTLAIVLCLAIMSRGNDTTKPWTFWYWMYGAVSEEGIKADLQAMKDVGLGGCYLMPIRGTEEKPEYEGKAQQLTPRFWEMVDYAMQQSDSLGLGMGIHICDGFALAGGPWITPKESMQKIVSMQTTITGGTGKRYILMQPGGYEGYYEDIACYAIPSENCGLCVSPASFQPVITTSKTVTHDDNGTFRASEAGWIQYEYPEIVTFHSVEIIPSGNNIQSQRLKMLVSGDGEDWSFVKQFEPPRQGWQNTDYNFTYAIPKTPGRYFRFEWTPEGTEPGAEDLDAAKWKPVLKLKDIRLSDQQRIHQWEGKSGLVWRIAPETTAEEITDEECVKLKDIRRVELKNGRLAEPLPEGTWLVVRIGHTSTGHMNATAGGGKGLECDKFSEAAVRKQISHWFGEFMKRPHHEVVKYMHVDSWECGSQNWSDDFAEEFQKRRGYDLMPWLPVMVGIPVESAAKSEAVLRDVRQTINDLLQERFFKTVKACAQEYGVQLSCESVAPTMVSQGMEHYKYADMPMGEFWLNSPTHDKPNDMLDAISGAHIYGKDIIQAEGFTEVRGVWDETPASIKALLDRNFALGMNRLFFHVNTHNPWLDHKPGMTLDGIGLFFQRDQTWYAEAKPFVDYITRCQTLLQKGKPVIDIAVYTGEEMPNRALTPDRLVSMLPGLFGAERVASERKRLANVGQPMEESPVGVSHSAGILDLKDWINPLHGYQYDSMNKDALLTQPFNFKVLVVPMDIRLSDEVKDKIAELCRKGVIIIDKPYTQDTIASVPRDVKMSNDDGIAFTHRRDGNTDIYFVSNQKYREEPVLMSFNICGKQVIYYDALTNEYSCPVSWERNGRTVIECGFPAVGSSGFIIFSDSDFVSQADSPFAMISPNGTDSQSERDELTVRTGRTKNEPWDVLFQESGISLKNQQLFDWSQHEDDRIRYFSGHARYTTTWKLKKNEVPQGRAWLSFSKVKDIAHVWINGKDYGIAWTAPYEVEVTGALHKGKNTIEIEVVNTWHNALRGMDKGKAPYDGIWTNAKYRTKGDGLLPAGLLEQPILKTTN
jgi:hypothetical protein